MCMLIPNAPGSALHGIAMFRCGMPETMLPVLFEEECIVTAWPPKDTMSHPQTFVRNKNKDHQKQLPLLSNGV